jgi:hypothetical protein
VRYIVVHHALYDTPSEAAILILKMLRSPDLVPDGRYKDVLGEATLFQMR